MRNLLRFAQAAFAAAIFLVGTGCSESTSTPLAIPSDSEAAGKESQGTETLPQLIADAVNQAMPGGTIVAAFREKEHGKNIYEVEVEVDGQRFEVEVDESGKVLEIEKDDGDADDK